MKRTPVDPKMYERVKKRIYKKYPKHSAYRSGLLVQAYKKEFAKKYGKKEPYTGTKTRREGLSRWFAENWKSDTGNYRYTSKRSVYRPTKRITKDTPLTFSELTKKEIQLAKRTKARKGRIARFRKK